MLSSHINFISSIKNITIDTSVFQNRAYIALRDYPVTLGSETVGRVNPFAPIGVDSASPVAQDTLVQTLQAGKSAENKTSLKKVKRLSRRGAYGGMNS